MFVERFRREATAIASLNHPNVVVIYDHGVADEQPFIAMEYVPGRTLKQIIGGRRAARTRGRRGVCEPGPRRARRGPCASESCTAT